ncbi:MAG TPA: DUF3352 domain-containing protein [Solirubrobacteraceae bacterium]|nr:DUF3352 domain-containing protein [Solirubrobacteraceae bacterium]
MRNLAPINLRHRWTAVAVLLAAVVVAAVAVALSGGAGSRLVASGTTSVIPADALAYVRVSLDRGSPAVQQALRVANRFPAFGLGGGVALGRLNQVLAGGRAVDYSSQVSPWIGHGAALALLDTTTSTAGSLVVVEVSNRARARRFVRAEGATATGSYRGTTLLGYPNGAVLAFAGSDLVVGQDASVRAAVDVAAGVSPSLSSGAAYRRAAATAPANRVLEAYASAAGVRRVLAGQSGVLGALGGLLYQPALQAVFMSLVPTGAGARIRFHSVLDRSRLTARGPAFIPSLQSAMPASASLMLDVMGLDHVVPQVLNAGSAVGITGGLGPVLSRLGSALSAEGVNVKDIVSLFHGESAVAIVPMAQSPALVIIARTSDPARAQTELAQLEAPLAKLFRVASGGSGSGLAFRDRRIAGITVHQLQLTPGFQFDYAVLRGMVVISTGLQGMTQVVENSHPLAGDSSFTTALGGRPRLVTSLVFANLAQLLKVGDMTSLTGSATWSRIQPDLRRIGAVGLTSSRGLADSTTELTIQVR